MTSGFFNRVVCALQTFEFITNDDGTVAYLYRLTSGHATRSFAHAAARSAGLDEQVVKRALEVIKEISALLRLNVILPLLKDKMTFIDIC